ncbi:MAG: hypothetical protein ABIR37_02520 [Candidatus Saccharimonadales bacterium]
MSLAEQPYLHPTPLETVQPLALPDFNIREHSQGSLKPHAEYLTQHDRFVMDDGSVYELDAFFPHQTKFDVPVLYTTPWFTDLRGFNSIYGKELARRGIVSYAISPERSSNPVDRVTHLGRISLQHDAYAQHRILEAIDDKGDGSYMSHGYSRGALLALGMKAMEDQFGHHQVYADCIDPPLEHAVRPSEMDLQSLAPYFRDEAKELVRSLTSHQVAEYLNMVRTIRLSGEFWVDQIATGFRLFTGQGGTFINNLPKDTRMHILHFEGSIFNHALYWQKRLEGFSGITCVSEPGLHMSGFRRDVISASIGRLVGEQQKL